MFCLQGDIIRHGADFPLQIRILCTALLWNWITFEFKNALGNQAWVDDKGSY